MGLLTRSMFVSPLLALAVPVVACVDPQQDYNDYANRTADAHAPPPTVTVDAGEAGPLNAPDAGFQSSNFLQACLTGDAEGNVSNASLFAATLTYVPSGGGGGTLKLSNHVLKINPASLSDTTGMAYTASPMSGATVKSDGTTTMTFGSTQIPGDANPVNMQNLTFSMTTLSFYIESETQICANLDATLTSPVSKSVTGPCIFRLLPSATAPLPSLQLTDFHCP